MTKARAISEGADLLLAAGVKMQLPIVASLDDISSLTPQCDEHGDRLADRFGWPKEFVDRWVDKAHTLTSPLFIKSRFETLPFVWSPEDVPAGHDFESRALRRSFEEFRSLGIVGGLAVPVRLTHGRLGGVHWWGSRSSPELKVLLAEHGPDLLVLSNYYFALFPDLQESQVPPENLASLTVREVECLTRAANGGSDAEIAKALALSQHTVRFHIENAADKLGARTRAHAIALAAQLGLIGKVA